ncbi:hypothetical protein JVU11DRAFT_10558 [Chiua virens]|nr:hypothetical protein JVU11DRAFT_10558 [Chiua virens]
MERGDENGPPPIDVRFQQQRSSIPSFLFIIFMLFLLTNHNGDEYLSRSRFQDALQVMNDQLSNYTVWLNGGSSNFSMPESPTALFSLGQSFVPYGPKLDRTHGSYFPNTTGFIRGSLDFYNITPHSLETTNASWKSQAQSFMSEANLTELSDKLGSWNWSATRNLAWSVVDRGPVFVEGVSERIAMIHGKIDLTDPTSAYDMQLEFYGVHFVSNGSIYGFAVPNGRGFDIRYIPVIVPESVRNETARVIKPELASRIKKVQEMIDAGVVEQESQGGNPETNCEFVLHAQIEPSPIFEELMQDLEDELQKPTGKWTTERPPMRLNGMLVSQHCGLLYRLHDADGLRSQSFFRKIINYASFSSIFYLVMLVLLSRQIDRAHTPAALTRLSLWGFLVQAIVDSVAFAGHITFAILTNGRSSMSLVAPAFLAFVLFALEAQHVILINQIQAPEDAATQQTRHTPSPAPSITTPATDPAQSPSPTASPRPAGPPFFQLVIRHLRADPQARIWLGMFLFITFIIRVIVSPSLTLLFLGCMYSMFWLPQIIRSAKQGRPSALSAEYLIGTSICRLYFALYFLTCPKNVLDVRPRRWAYYLCAFVLFQVAVVLLQQRLGPAFFLPKRFATTETYNYHPPLPLSVSDPEAPEQSLGDCSICMEAIHAEDPKPLQHVAAGLLQKVGGRKNYSLAPCHHLFHTECLEKWLAIKNICPQCRRPLPPL